jgi:hypothetical protein
LPDESRCGTGADQAAMVKQIRERPAKQSAV